ncbi:MAG: hypothetical protein JNJ64_12490 [Flavobacteriales bacterium]|nr:hypothetical protein [Flavobacteriales bacterium]
MSSTERTWIRVLPWMTLFTVAMALLESAVVVYLRALYYPDGFSFPPGPIDPAIAATEVGRELATLVMLFAPGAMVTRSALQRFAWFAFCFGVWDIFYYAFLWILIGWPASFTEWDLLFLVPLPWVGPVWAPILISVGLILLAVLILRGATSSRPAAPDRYTWVLFLLSASLFLTSFILDPVRWFSANGEPMLGIAAVNAFLAGFVPTTYPWPLALAGAALGSSGLLRLAVRTIGR